MPGVWRTHAASGALAAGAARRWPSRTAGRTGSCCSQQARWRTTTRLTASACRRGRSPGSGAHLLSVKLAPAVAVSASNRGRELRAWRRQVVRPLTPCTTQRHACLVSSLREQAQLQGRACIVACKAGTPAPGALRRARGAGRARAGRPSGGRPHVRRQARHRAGAGPRHRAGGGAPACAPRCSQRVSRAGLRQPIALCRGSPGPNAQQGRAAGAAASVTLPAWESLISISAWACVGAHAWAPGGGARRSSRCSGTACRSSCWRTCAWRACRTPTCWPRRAHPTLPWRGARCSAWRRVPYLTAHCVLPRLAPVWTALVCTCLHDAKVVGVVHVGVKRGAS